MGENSKLILLGGLMINIDGEGHDYFEPLSFTTMTKDGESKDLLHNLQHASFKHITAEPLADPVFVPAKMEEIESHRDIHSHGQKSSVRAHFATALPGSIVEEMVYQEISKLGITKENTVFAQSSCPDELNHDDYEEDITNLM